MDAVPCSHAARDAVGFMPDDEGLALHEAGSRGRARSGRCSRSARTAGSRRSTSARRRASGGSVLYTVDHHRGSEENQAGWEHHDDRLVDPRTGRMDTLPWFRRTIEDAGLEDVVIAVDRELADGRRALGDAARAGVHRRRPRVRRRARRLRGWARFVVPGGCSSSTTCSRIRPTAGRHRSKCGSARSHPATSNPRSTTGSLRVLRRRADRTGVTESVIPVSDAGSLAERSAGAVAASARARSRRRRRGARRR